MVALSTKLCDLVVSKSGSLAKVDAAIFGSFDAVQLALGADLGLEWANSPKHVELQPHCRVRCVDILIEDDQINAFLAQVLGDPTQVERRARQAVDARNHKIGVFATNGRFRRCRKRSSYDR